MEHKLFIFLSSSANLGQAQVCSLRQIPLKLRQLDTSSKCHQTTSIQSRIFFFKGSLQIQLHFSFSCEKQWLLQFRTTVYGKILGNSCIWTGQNSLFSQSHFPPVLYAHKVQASSMQVNSITLIVKAGHLVTEVMDGRTENPVNRCEYINQKAIL